MRRPDLRAVGAVMARDLVAVRRSRPVVIPMVVLPALLLVAVPALVGLVARTAVPPDVGAVLAGLPGGLGDPVLDLPEHERFIVLVNGYLMAPLFLVVPLLVASVLAADAFAGERERGTLETLLHLPVDTRDLFLAKLAVAFVPAVAVSWVGFVAFAVVVNTLAWPVLGRVFVPTALWVVMIAWVGPGVAALGLGVMVRVSARTRTVQEASQIGGAVVLPLVIVAVGQSSGLLLVTVPVALAMGAAVWALAAVLVWGGARRFTRDALVTRG
jgi:ABC-2 type transport system permease protein